MASDSDSVPISIYDMLPVFIEQSASVAWQKLGLQHDSVTGKLATDLAEAKVAVDLVASLAEVLVPKLDDDDRRQVQNLVRDLRMNFVAKQKEAHPQEGQA